MAVVWARLIWALIESFDSCFHSAILTNRSVSLNHPYRKSYVNRIHVFDDSPTSEMSFYFTVLLWMPCSYIIGFPDVVGELSVLNTPCFVHIFEISFLPSQWVHLFCGFKAFWAQWRPLSPQFAPFLGLIFLRLSRDALRTVTIEFFS